MSIVQLSAGEVRSSSTSRLPEATTPTIACARVPPARFGAVSLKLSVSMRNSSPVAEAAGRTVETAGSQHEFLDRAGRQQTAVGVERIDAEIFRAPDHAALPELLDELRVTCSADVGVSGNAADRLLTLVLVAAH